MNNEIQFILYQLPDEEGKVQVVIKDETIWATQKAIAQLFGIDKSGVSRHIANIYKDGELQQETTIAKIATVVNRGIRGEVEEQIDFYNLDVIIAVGYRVSSARATRFRQWATKILNEYIKKGFVLDEERLKQGTAVFGKDYFRELLEKVRSIRASERRIWQQITDIYAECSFDYDRNSPTTREFYQMVQNRFHYAITGQTTPEELQNLKLKTNISTMRQLFIIMLLATAATANAQSLETSTAFPTGYMETSYFDEANTVKSIDGVLYMLYDDIPIVLVKYPPMNPREEYEIPSTVRRINNNAFQGTKYLKTLKMHNTVTYNRNVKLAIGETAFNDSSIENFVVIENDAPVNAAHNEQYALPRTETGRYDLTGRTVDDSHKDTATKRLRKLWNS